MSSMLLLLRRAPLPRLAQAARPRCCHGGAALAPAPARRNALKLLQGLLKHERGGGKRGGGDRRRWRPRREAGALSPDAWALVENLAEKGQLKAPHATAVLAASIFHFGQHTVGEAKAHLKQSGVPIRE